MVTAAGCFSGVSSSTNGTKKLPHWPTNTKIATTATPGAIRGATTRRSDWTQPAPSTQAASSRLTGTPSMKFFIIQMANGSALAVRNSTIAGTEPYSWKRKNIA